MNTSILLHLMKKYDYSIIEDYVNSFDIQDSNKRLITKVQDSIDSHIYHHEVPKPAFMDVARITMLSEERLRDIFEKENPKIYREEFEWLTTAFGFHNEYFLGLPDVGSREVMSLEWQILQERGLADKGMCITKAEEKDEYLLRWKLFSICTEMCLDKYELLSVPDSA